MSVGRCTFTSKVSIIIIIVHVQAQGDTQDEAGWSCIELRAWHRIRGTRHASRRCRRKHWALEGGTEKGWKEGPTAGLRSAAPEEQSFVTCGSGIF